MIKIFIASDHAGVELKSKLLMELRSANYTSRYEVMDLGPQSTESVDYPDFADLVCKKIHGFSLLNSDAKNSEIPSATELGILICGSGQGMAMRANKYSHIRAALCWSVEVAKLSRSHNDANVLCLAGREIKADLNLKIMREFLATNFEGGRHQGRVLKVSTPLL